MSRFFLRQDFVPDRTCTLPHYDTNRLIKILFSDMADLRQFEESFNTYRETIDNFNNSEKIDEIHLLVGTTGSGKTTVAKFLIDDPSLISKETTAGSREFIICDGTDEISSMISSQTSVPKMYPRANRVYCDCPGFDDNMSNLADIFGMGLIKEVAEKERRVKLIVVVNYDSLRIGVERNAFLDVVRNVCSLVKNVEKIRDSILLVVSKVGNEGVRDGVRGSEEIVVGILGYLKAVIGHMKERRCAARAKKDRLFYTTGLKLVSSILEKRRVVIFRRPKEPGFLNGLEWKEQRKGIEGSLESIGFVKVNKNDFGYAISDASRNYINRLSKDINEKTVKHLEELNLIAYFEKEVEGMSKPSDISATLSIFLKDLNNLMVLIDEAQNGSKLLDTLSNYFEKINLPFGKPPFVSFLEGIQTIPHQIDSRIFQRTAKRLQDMKEAYDLIQHLQFTITSPHLESKERSFEDWVEDLKTSYDTTILEVIRNNKRLFDLFNSITKLSAPPKTKLTSDVMTFLGYKICLSEVNACLGKVTTSISEVVIFGLSTFVVDEDFRGANLVAIAPCWHVLGSREIVLKGENARDHQLGTSTEHGLPGYHGKPGGAFLGIAHSTVGLERLTIDTSGGDGSPGQNGGDGRNGTDAELTLPSPTDTFLEGYNKIQRYNPDTATNQSQPLLKTIISLAQTFVRTAIPVPNIDTKIFIIPPQNGSPGEDGLKGGEGGKGALPGPFLFLSPTATIPSFISKPGRNGANGTPGTPGKGGKSTNPINITATESSVALRSLEIPGTILWNITGGDENGTAEDGNINEVLNKCTELPENPRQVDVQKYVRDYSTLISKENTDVSPNLNDFMEFLQFL